MISVIHVVRDLDLASGGPSRSVPLLAMHQADTELLQPYLLFSDTGNASSGLGQDVPRIQIPASFSAWRKELNALISRLRQTSQVVVHIHGIWSRESFAGAFCARREQVPYIVSIRGMLAPWALQHKALKKQVAWHLYQKHLLTSAARLLASSTQELNEIGRKLPKSRIEVLPNGIGIPTPTAGHCLPALARILENDFRIAVAIGRLHPVKGFADLIDAWAYCKPRGWTLLIAGPDENGYKRTLEAAIRQHGLQDVIRLLGEVDDDAKWALLSKAELLFAPSYTENFGMAIAEALVAGVPVVTTTRTPWHAIISHQCGWQIEPGRSALMVRIPECTEMSVEELTEMGARGKDYVTENFSWNAIAKRSVDIYSKVLHEDLSR